jgi:hypothetical protein
MCGAHTAASCNAQVVLPLLGGLLLYQYTLLIGLPPGLHWGTLRYNIAAQQPAMPAFGGYAAHHHHSRPPDAPSTAILLKVTDFGVQAAQAGADAFQDMQRLCYVSGDLFWLLLQSWLGLEAVDRAALWALFFAWGISVIQVLLV